MKLNWIKQVLWVSLVITLQLGCSRSEVEVAPKGPVVVPTTNPENEESIVIDPKELIDRTVSETSVAATSYAENNGRLLQETNDGETRTVTRTFVLTFAIKDYSLPSERKLFLEPKKETGGALYEKDSPETMTSDQLLVRFSPNEKSPEKWLKVVVSDGRSGWWFVGTGDPYANDRWAIVKTITLEGKTQNLLKFDSMFSTQRGQPAYDRPSLTGSTVLWKAEPTVDNDQINLTSFLVTQETYQGQYWSEHWVKVRDAHGRVGWFPGDSLEVERGGFKYNSPENMVRYAFYEP